MKSTLETIKEMEKEFDEAVYAEAKKRCFKSQTAVIFWDGFGGYDVEEKWKKEVMSDSNFVKSFISSYTRTLLESFGEEVCPEWIDNPYGEVTNYSVGRRDERKAIRLKVKEILQNIT